jgi:hypothetical protein
MASYDVVSNICQALPLGFSGRALQSSPFLLNFSTLEGSFKLSVGSGTDGTVRYGIESRSTTLVNQSEQVHFENPTDRLVESPTRS